jgi:hypothetical protein
MRRELKLNSDVGNWAQGKGRGRVLISRITCGFGD